MIAPEDLQCHVEHCLRRVSKLAFLTLSHLKRYENQTNIIQAQYYYQSFKILKSYKNINLNRLVYIGHFYFHRFLN